MKKYIAFLRAINVGGHTVKMDRLRELFESLGFANVETFIASGNVIFETKEKNAASLENKFAAHLEKSLGYEVDTFLRTVQEVVEIEQHSPFELGKKGSNVYVAFLHEPPGAAEKSALMALKNKSNDFAIPGREVYWLRLNKDDSIFLKTSLEKILKVSATMRNMTTVSKLVEKYK
jgi:uncharacterized protein (DUF1697 family)